MAYFKSLALTVDLRDSVDNLTRRQHQESKFEARHEHEKRPNGSPGSVCTQPCYLLQAFVLQFLSGFLATSISHLQSILHNAARVIFLNSSFDHVILPLTTLLRFPVICRIRQDAFHGDLRSLSPIPISSALLLSHQPLHSSHFHSLTLLSQPGLFSLPPSACKATCSFQESWQVFAETLRSLWSSSSVGPFCNPVVTLFIVFITVVAPRGL